MLEIKFRGKSHDNEGKVDGRIGRETLRAWSVEICNDYYRKTIARMEKEK